MNNPRFASPETMEKTLKVTPEEFVNYLNSIAPTSVCTFCGGDWGVTASPDGETAALIATPVPNGNGIGVWFFVASCVKCGNSMFFNATRVARTIKGGI